MLRPKLQKDKRAKPRAGGVTTKSHGRHARGMLYENETMRLRALEMASEADRHSGDVRRLRRENERLKQQMYAAKDDRERLERFVDELEQLAVDSAGVQQCNNVASSSSSSSTSSSSDSNTVVCSQRKNEDSNTLQRTNGPDHEPRLVSTLSMNDLHSIVVGSYGHLNVDRLLDVALDFHADRLSNCTLTIDDPFLAPGVINNNNNHISSQRHYNTTTNNGMVGCGTVGGPLDSGPGQLALLRCASVEPLTVVFSVRDCAALVELSVCDVVDELQQQYGTISDLSDVSNTESSLSPLDVQCVRLDGDAVFITCGCRTDMERLLTGGLQVRGHHVQLSDVMAESVVVEVGGVPVHVSDENVRALVSTFGTTIGQVERQLYRGVDAGRRRARVRLREEVTLPQTVTVAGNKLTVQVATEFDSDVGGASICHASTCANFPEVKKIPNGYSGVGKCSKSANGCPPFSVSVDKTNSGGVISSLLRLQPPSHAGEETRVKHRVKPFIRSPTFTGNPNKNLHKPSFKIIDSEAEFGRVTSSTPAGSVARESNNSTVDSVARRRAPERPGTGQNRASLSSMPPPVDPLRAKLAQRAKLLKDCQRERRPSDEVSDPPVDRRDSDLAESVTSSRQLAPDSKSASSQDSAELPWCGCWGMCCF